MPVTAARHRPASVWRWIRRGTNPGRPIARPRRSPPRGFDRSRRACWSSVLAGSRIRADAAGSLVRPIGEGGSHLELVADRPDPRRGVLAGRSQPHDPLRAAGRPAGRRLALRPARTRCRAPCTRSSTPSCWSSDPTSSAASRASTSRSRTPCSTSSASASSRSSARSRAAPSRPSASGSRGSSSTSRPSRVAAGRASRGSPSSSSPTPWARSARSSSGSSAASARSGIVATGSRSITILDPDRLAADVGDATPAVWNPGS